MSAYIPVELRRRVRARARGRCEYCRLPAVLGRATFECDHVRALRHGGATVAANLALACPDCNLWKGPNLAAYDPESDRPAFLFDPRASAWTDHFRTDGDRIVGLTPAGRATAAFLLMNRPDRRAVRTAALFAGYRYD